MLLSYVNIEILLFLIHVFGVKPLQMQLCSNCASLQEEVEKLKQRNEELENLHGMSFFCIVALHVGVLVQGPCWPCHIKFGLKYRAPDYPFWAWAVELPWDAVYLAIHIYFKQSRLFYCRPNVL